MSMKDVQKACGYNPLTARVWWQPIPNRPWCWEATYEGKRVHGRSHDPQAAHRALERAVRAWGFKKATT